jgi:hypothetical protein
MGFNSGLKGLSKYIIFNWDRHLRHISCELDIADFKKFVVVNVFDSVYTAMMIGLGAPVLEGIFMYFLSPEGGGGGGHYPNP